MPLSALDGGGDGFCAKLNNLPLVFVVVSSPPEGLVKRDPGRGLPDESCEGDPKGLSVSFGMASSPVDGLVATGAKRLLPDGVLDVELNNPPLGFVFAFSPLEGLGDGVRKLLPIDAPAVDPNSGLLVAVAKSVLPNGALDVELNNPPLGFVLAFSPSEGLVVQACKASLKAAADPGFGEREG